MARNLSVSTGSGEARVLGKGKSGKPVTVRTRSKLTDAAIDAAIARGKASREVEPRASSVHYDRKHRSIIVKFTNGCLFSFPAHLAQGLDKATDEQLASVEILGKGSGLHWETLDTDLSIPGLVNNVFGTRKYMARLGGRSKSPAKSAAARANGLKGGRPRKVALAG
jgi:hypothetical protein